MACFQANPREPPPRIAPARIAAHMGTVQRRAIAPHRANALFVGSRTARYPDEPVSSPRLIERRRRISRTPLSCLLRAMGYVTYRPGALSGAAQYRTR